MKKQFLFINGGNPKERFSSYYEFLNSLEYNPFEQTFLNWNRTLGDKLGDDWEYFRAPFRERHYADYESWKIMFEKMFPYLRDDIIIGAGSLGGTFIIKYLSENIFPVKIKRLIFVAAALHDTKEEKLGSFTLNKEMIPTIISQLEEIIIYHSRDDTMVPFSDFEMMKVYFPAAIFREFTDRGHFHLEAELPEIVEDIKR